MTYSGDFIQVAVNGYDLAQQIEQSTYQHSYGSNKIQPDNVGVEQYAPGILKPQCSLSGFTKRGQGAVTGHNLFRASGAAVDTEYIALLALGANTTPVAGDLCVAFDGTLTEYTRTDEMTAFQKWQATLKPRGVRIPAFPVLLVNASQTGSLTSTAYDDGAESVDTVSGGVAILEVLTPTGTAASGTISLTGQPSDGDTFTINGTVYTFKTALTPTANQVLIGATAAATANNLFQALVGDPSTSGTNYAAGTTALPSTLIPSVPSSAQVITITYSLTGTAGNAITLVKSGTNLAVSGATMAGGVAGETATIVVQSATSSGGSYATCATFTLDLTARGAQVITVAAGTTISRYLKVVVTMSGSTQTWAARVAFARFYSGQV
jgi:hypothetical protein